jgi:hypothetical protein
MSNLITVIKQTLRPTMVRSFADKVRQASVCGDNTQLLRYYDYYDDNYAKLARIERFVDLPPTDQCFSTAFFQIVENARSWINRETGEYCHLFKDEVNLVCYKNVSFLSHTYSTTVLPYGKWHITALVPLVPYTQAQTKTDCKPIETTIGDIVLFDGPATYPKHDAPIGLYLTFVGEHDSAGSNSERNRYYRERMEKTHVA